MYVKSFIGTREAPITIHHNMKFSVKHMKTEIPNCSSSKETDARKLLRVQETSFIENLGFDGVKAEPSILTSIFRHYGSKKSLIIKATIHTSICSKLEQ